MQASPSDWDKISEKMFEELLFCPEHIKLTEQTEGRQGQEHVMEPHAGAVQPGRPAQVSACEESAQLLVLGDFWPWGFFSKQNKTMQQCLEQLPMEY